jgi:RHS repeat-associated protein
LGMFYTYDHDNDDPRARGNLLKLELVAPPYAPQPSRIIQILSYEPHFHRLKAIRDEAGKLTSWVYDYEALTGTVGDVVRIEYPAATLPDGTSQSRVERFTYNTFGQISEQQTAAGHRHVFTYSAAGTSNGYLTSITWDADGAAQTQTIEYDAQGHRSAFIDGLGNRTEAVTDALDRTTTLRLPAISGVVDEIHLKYTPDGRVRREEWPRGSYSDSVITDPFIANEFTYDIFGNRTSAIYGVNSATPLAYHYQYTPEGQLLSVIDPLNRDTRFTYDERGLMLTQTEAVGTPIEAQWHYAYDRSGNRTVVIDPVGHRFDYRYDAWDRLVGLTLPGFPDAERTHISLTLNRFDRVERTLVTGRISPGSIGTLLDAFTDYDERGRPWRHQLDSRSMVYTYDADERVIHQVDQRGHSATFEWDGLNRIVRATDPLGNVMVHRYDVAGNLTGLESHEQLPGNGAEIITTSIAYDSRLRPTTITAPLNRISRKVYDARGLAIQEIDQLGRVVERTFGLRGEPLSVTTQVATGITATHHLTYDSVGRQIAYTDPEGRVTAYTYDERDRRTRIVYPDGRTHRFMYDMHRQIAVEETPGGTVKTFAYGADAGLTRIDFAPGPDVAATPPLSLFCDGLRRVVYMEQGSLRLSRTFDASLRLRSETLDSHTASIDYDDAAGTARFAYPDGRVDHMAFDALGRPSSVTLVDTGSAALTGTLAPGTQLASYEYRGPERMARRTLHTGLVTEFDYDDACRMTAIRHVDAAGAPLLTLRYVYDAANRCHIVWVAPAPAIPTRFDYDGLSRIRVAALDLPLTEPASNLDQLSANAVITTAEAQIGAAEEDYTVNRSDARTEITRQSVSGTITDTYTLTPTYEISRVDRSGPGAGIFNFTFDGDGRCTQDDRYHYRYDAMGRLIEVQELASLNTILTQVYDPAGRVVRRTEDATTYEQTYLGLRLLQRHTTAGQPLLQLTPGLGVDEILMESTGTNRYPLQDAASSLHCYVDAAGTVLERYRYSPFGEPTIWASDGITSRSTTAIAGLPRFGGYPLLNAGLYDARARMYEPRTGRFLQPDPMGYLDSANLYIYTHHDPVGFTDPTGEAAILVGLLIAAGVGLVVGGGLNAARQGIQIHEGSRKEFSWGEMGLSAGVGAIAGPVLTVAPELAIPLTAYGVSGGIEEYSQGHRETGIFDVVTSLAPYGLKGVRSATFGEGTVFAPARGLGPSATATERFARIPELGRSTQELAGQIWNERFYHGTTRESAEAAVSDINKHLQMVRILQQLPGTRHLGEGLYFGRTIGNSTLEGSAAWWAQQGGSSGRGGTPAIVEASIPRWRLALLRREPGVQIDVPQQNFPNAPQSFFPFEGSLDGPPGGPAARFGALARWRIIDPNSPQPNLSDLWPTALIRPIPWPQVSTPNNGTK